MSVTTGVGGYFCHIYARYMHIAAPHWKFTNRSPNSASINLSRKFSWWHIPHEIGGCHSWGALGFADGVLIYGYLPDLVLEPGYDRKETFLCSATPLFWHDILLSPLGVWQHSSIIIPYVFLFLVCFLSVLLRFCSVPPEWLG